MNSERIILKLRVLLYKSKNAITNLLHQRKTWRNYDNAAWRNTDLHAVKTALPVPANANVWWQFKKIMLMLNIPSLYFHYGRNSPRLKLIVP